MYFSSLKTIEEKLEYKYNENISKYKILFKIYNRLNKYKTSYSIEEEYYWEKIEKKRKKKKRINKLKKIIGVILCPCLCLSYCCVSVICDVPMSCCLNEK